MERRYYHAKVVLKDGELVCCACGAKVDETLRFPNPCAIPTSSATIVNHLPILISVYNCRAFLVAEIPVSPSTVRVVPLEYDEKIADLLEELIENDVYGAGGGLNMSGYYPLSDKTAELVAKWLEDGKIWLDF